MAGTKIKQLRDFPSIEEILEASQIKAEVAVLPRPLVSDVIREIVAAGKTRLKDGEGGTTREALFEEIRNSLVQVKRREHRRVINASGVIVHTNLGRAPLSESLFDAIKGNLTGYSNIEFDLEKGARGKRGRACERYLASLSGAEAATVVNNCAAALFLILNTLANRRKVIISRGELVQIGGGFRIPDILKRSGAKLVEVGTTNITSLDDYRQAAHDGAALILKVHKSNFVQAGFTGDVPLRDLIPLAVQHKLPIVNDLGSGVFVPTKPILGYAEPTVQQSVRAGADLTCFSGDKLLGGVQSGLIVGRADLVAGLKRNPIFRTVRVDKIVYAALEQMLTSYLNGTYVTEIKLWAMSSVPLKELRKRANYITKKLGKPALLALQETDAYIGGGALPEAAIPSVGLVFSEEYRPTQLTKRFLANSPPIVGRVENDRFLLDLKAVDAEELDLLVAAIKPILD